MIRIQSFPALVLLSAAALVAAEPGKTHLKVGDTAPEFKLPSTGGQPVSLGDFLGKNTVVLAFFPAAFTGGCTKEMQNYTAGISQFDTANAKVFAVSTDNLPTLNHWAKEHLNATFPMLSDFMRKASTDYGVLIPERGIASRTTFVIDPAGKIQHIDEGSAAIDLTGAATACARLKK
jgi:peroxiredoxin